MEFIIEGKEPKAPVIISLREETNGIVVLANGWGIAKITEQGIKHLSFVPKDVGFPLTSNGSLKTVE